MGSTQSFAIVSFEIIKVVKDFLVIESNQVFACIDSSLHLLNVEAQISHSLFQAFEGNHHFSLDLDSVFVVGLLEDIFRPSEFAHLLVEVSSGQLLSVLL